MSKPLNILIVEDSKDDVDLLILVLRRAGFDPKWKRVETESDFLAELKNLPDVILSDYSLPHFSGLRAMKLLHEGGWDIPFILISGTIGESVAVDAMQQGATDYLLKDRLGRLGNAVERAIEQRRLRADGRRLEEALRESERRFSNMLEKIELASMMLDQEARITYCNDYLLQLTGWQREEALGRNWFDMFLPPDVVPELRVVHGKLIGDFPDAWHYENDIVTRSGSRRLIRWNNSVLRSPSGDVIGTASIGEDVTEHKQAEEKLRESELKFRQLAEYITKVFWITDIKKHQILYVSPAYEKIWGRSCESLYQSPLSWLDAIHVEDRERILQAAVSKQERGDYDEVYRIIRPDNSVRWIHDRAFPVRNPAGEIYRVVGTAEDITERKQLEEQFRQSQKLEAIGQLAGGVAHDFNNILTSIFMQVELAAMDSDLSAEIREGLQQIHSDAERAASLTRQLLLFSRRQVMQSRDLDLNEVVTNLAKMLQRIIGEDVRLQLNLNPTPLLTHADAGMLDQVLMNLAVNARDAMPDGGHLTIATSSEVVGDPPALNNPDATPGRYVCFGVSDNGCGIPTDVLPRIFEPFFTTKELGKGTGLGLATVFGIVRHHRGWLKVDSQTGRGTTFQVYLPANVAAAAPVMATARPKTPGGTETILLVEDDFTVRKPTMAFLTRNGYKVLEAANGVEALKVWEENHASVNLLLTDLVLPAGMTGQQLARGLQKDKPDLKVIFTSGYSTELAGREIKLEIGENFVQKPFRPEELLKTIRNSLDG